MPEGAQTWDLDNIAAFRSYLTPNTVENWYRYANGRRGREARNGDLRLVIGFDKTASWGMAALSNAGIAPIQLSFKSMPDADSSACTYKWECSGLVEARTGPGPQEAVTLLEDDTDPPPGGKYLNQCLFVRSLNARLSDGIWHKLCQELGTPHLNANGTSGDVQDHSSPDHIDHSETSTSQGSIMGASSIPGIGSPRALYADSGSVLHTVNKTISVSNPPTSIVSMSSYRRVVLVTFVRTGFPPFRSFKRGNSQEGM